MWRRSSGSTAPISTTRSRCRRGSRRTTIRSPIYGWGGDDTITLGEYGGNVYGGDGDDTIDGRTSQYGGYLYGDAGDDTIYIDGNEAFGGDGRDRLFGSYRFDRLNGGDGNDILDGDRSSDTLSGDAGADRLYGGEGDDFLDGGANNDLIYGDTGYREPDQFGDDYNDGIAGGTGADTIYGEAGDDRIFADVAPDDGIYGIAFDTGGEKDVVSGGDGDDMISAGINDDADGGEGIDTLVLSFATSDHGITLRTSDLLKPDYRAGPGTFSGFEQVGAVRGSEFADRIKATADVDGGGGNDRLTALFAGITLTGGAGNDILISARGENTLIGGDGIDTVDYGRFAGGVSVFLGDEYPGFSRGGSGPDGDYLAEIENVTGSRGADTISGNNQDNRLVGGGGDDTLAGGSGDDVLDGGAGADAMSGGEGDDSYLVDTAGDTVVEDADFGIDTVQWQIDFTLGDNVGENLVLIGGGHAGVGNGLGNRMTGSDGADTLSGLGGNDVLLGRAGRDVIDAGDGDDTVTGGGDRDTLTGGTGADVFRFTAGNTGTTAATADTITDFSHAQHDKINLSAVDAVAGTAANDAFRFVGDAAFSGSAGELRYEVSHGNTLVMGDTDGDGAADLVISLTGNVALVASDFVLGNGSAFVVGEKSALIGDTHALVGGGLLAMPHAHEMVV